MKDPQNLHALKEQILKDLPKTISRRDALKLSALISSTALLSPSTLAADENSSATTKVQSNAKIVIVGGGDAGITISARLTRLLETPDITIIEPNDTHYYQPGQTLVGGGVWDLDDIAYEFDDVIQPNVKVIKDKVTHLDPDNNKVTVSKGDIISYDYLVLATGLELTYQAIEGLTPDMLGNDGIHSIYLPESAEKVFPGFEELVSKAKSKKVKAIFTHPESPIKCGGAPKKIMYLFENYLRDEGVRHNVEIIFAPNGGKYFGVPEYNTAVEAQFKEKNIIAKFKHNLIKVDAKAGKATFLHTFEEKGAFDEDLQEFDMITKTKKVEMNFDFLHVVPPMKAHDVVKNSPLAWQKGSNGTYGLVEVDELTLQHNRYANVFSAGDVIGTKFGKTGGSVRKQAPVVAHNLVAIIQGKRPTHHYSGYTVCPLITGYGSVMLAEFDYAGVAPSFPLDPTKDRWIWWLLKVYALKPMYHYGMLQGRM